MTGLIEEIQAKALDQETPIAALLRHVKAAATKLGLEETIAWVEAELNGYSTVESIPTYRHITGRVMVHDPYKGQYPLVGAGNIIEKMGMAYLREPISSLEECISGEKSDLMVPLSRAIVDKINRMNGGYHCDINNHITTSSLVGVVDQVRNLALDWALALEKEGVLGEGISFSKEEKQIAQSSQITIINYGHYHHGDNNGDHNSSVVG